MGDLRKDLQLARQAAHRQQAREPAEPLLSTGTYRLHLRARETATSKDRDYRPADPIRLTIT